MRRIAIIFATTLALAVGVPAPLGALSTQDELEVLNLEVTRLYNEGQYADALPIAERAVAIAEQLHGPKHLAVSAACTALASLYYQLSRYSEAEPLQKRALGIREEHHGGQHLDVAAALIALAGTYYYMPDRPADAVPLYERALGIREARLGPDDAQTTRTRQDLADTLYKMRRYSDALVLYRRILVSRERTLGEGNSLIARTVQDIADVLANEGRHTDAEPMSRRALAIRESVLGRDHKSIAYSLNQLAWSLEEQGRLAEAFPLLKRAAQIQERISGPNDALTGFRLRRLAENLGKRAKYVEAEKHLLRAIRVFELDGEKSELDLADSVQALAVIRAWQSKFTESIRLLESALALKRRILPESDPSLAETLRRTGQAYRWVGREREAEPLLSQALAIRERSFPPNHRLVAESLTDLAAVVRGENRMRARDLYERALAILLAEGKTSDPLIGTCQLWLGWLKYKESQYSEAEALNLKALENYEAAYGPDHPETAYVLNNLGDIYYATGNLKRAKELYQRTLKINLAKFGADHSYVAMAYENLAWIARREGRLDDAIKLFEKAMASNTRALGATHPFVGYDLAELASIHFGRQEWAKARSLWQKSTEIIVGLQRLNAETLGQGPAGTGRNRTAKNKDRFVGLVKASYRLQRPDASAQVQAGSTFQSAQWAQSTEAATAFAKMAVRTAKGDTVLAALVRERQDLVGEWRDMDKQLVAAKSRKVDKGDRETERALSDRLAAIDARLTEIDDRLAKDFADYAALASPNPSTVEEVQARLREDEALLLIFDTPKLGSTPEETFVWVVTKSDSRWVRSKLGTTALQKHVAAVRCGLDRSGEWQWSDQKSRWIARKRVCRTLRPAGLERNEALPFDLARAYALYRGLFDRVEDLIKGKSIFVVPSGALTSLPFQVLVTGLPEGPPYGTKSREVTLLGAKLGPVSDKTRRRLKLASDNGVVVVRLVAEGPAAMAGLKENDILLSVGNTALTSVPQAIATVQAQMPRASVQVRLLREKNAMEVAVTLGVKTISEWVPRFFQPAAGNTNWLVERHALTILPSVASLVALRRNAKPSAAPKPFIGFGNPQLRGSPGCGKIRVPKTCPGEESTVAFLPNPLSGLGAVLATVASYFRNGQADLAEVRKLCPLPDTEYELQCVARSLGAPASSIVLGEDMTETAIKAMALDRYRVVHFATHGLLAGETARLAKTQAEPALVFSPPDKATEEDDGLLTASEVTELKLDADWVVMSACNTASGEGPGAEALSGLAKAFFYAGARALLVSHWPVNSYAATMLTSRTFAEMKKRPTLGRSEAFRRAMLALMNNKDRPWAAHPSVWAPFTVVGEGGAKDPH